MIDSVDLEQKEKWKKSKSLSFFQQSNSRDNEKWVSLVISLRITVIQARQLWLREKCFPKFVLFVKLFEAGEEQTSAPSILDIQIKLDHLLNWLYPLNSSEIHKIYYIANRWHDMQYFDALTSFFTKNVG